MRYASPPAMSLVVVIALTCPPPGPSAVLCVVPHAAVATANASIAIVTDRPALLWSWIFISSSSFPLGSERREEEHACHREDYLLATTCLAVAAFFWRSST